MPDELVESEYAAYDDPGLKDFTVSRLSTLTEDQRAAVIGFLEAVVELGDDHVAEQAGKALAWWRGQ